MDITDSKYYKKLDEEFNKKAILFFEENGFEITMPRYWSPLCEGKKQIQGNNQKSTTFTIRFNGRPTEFYNGEDTPSTIGYYEQESLNTLSVIITAHKSLDLETILLHIDTLINEKIYNNLGESLRLITYVSKDEDGNTYKNIFLTKTVQCRKSITITERGLKIYQAIDHIKLVTRLFEKTNHPLFLDLSRFKSQKINKQLNPKPR